RMAGRRAIIRKLPAVETLGSTTVICSDKTGTLTRNEMTVQALWTPEGAYRLSGIGYTPTGELRTAEGKRIEETPPDVEELVRAGVLCNDAVLSMRQDGWQVTGDPTEGAMVVAAQKLGCDPRQLRTRYRRLDVVPFESERQFMATLHEAPESGRVIYLKGAPEVVLKRCTLPNLNGTPLEQRVMEEVERIASQGMRVLAFAVRRPRHAFHRLEEDDVATGFTFLGLQGMIDPPRPEVIEAVRACREAGIAVKMITGDHKETARAIGA